MYISHKLIDFALDFFHVPSWELRTSLQDPLTTCKFASLKKAAWLDDNSLSIESSWDVPFPSSLWQPSMSKGPGRLSEGIKLPSRDRLPPLREVSTSWGATSKNYVRSKQDGQSRQQLNQEVDGIAPLHFRKTGFLDGLCCPINLKSICLTYKQDKAHGLQAISGKYLVN